MREKKPNTSTIRWNEEDMRYALSAYAVPDDIAAEIVSLYEAKREAGPDKACQAIIYHGPGHQSWSYCEAQGDHYGEHYANLTYGPVEWETPEDPSMPVFAGSL